jgi:predicted Zn-dependent peptidase
VQSTLLLGLPVPPPPTPGFMRLSLANAVLGGSLLSRLDRNLREDKGYTYGIGAGFDMRRAAGPFSVRTAVQTAATVPSIAECLAELRRIRETEVTPAELAAARDYLVGVFPLRFETPGAVVAALTGVFVHGLPDDELTRYRTEVEAVTAASIQKAAQDHIHLDRIAIVAVGDADAVAADLESARFGQLEVITENVPVDADAGDTGERDE